MADPTVAPIADPYTGAPATNDPTQVNGDPVEQQKKDIAEGEAQKRAAQQQADAAAAAAAAKANYEGHYQYGGYANGANDASNRYRQQGEDAQKRQAGAINYTQADLDRGANLGARAGQVSMADLLAARANGSMPSIAGMRANQDITRALGDQSSIAASARGPAALALAQQQQANNSAQAMGNISNSAQINTAQERLNDTMAAGQAYTGIRGGDTALTSQDINKAQVQAQLDEAQREANDRYQLGMTGYEVGVQGANLQAQGNQIAGERGAYATQQGIDLAHDQNSTAKTAPWIAGGFGAGAAVTGGIVTGLLLPGGGTKDPNAAPTNSSAPASGDAALSAPGSYNTGSTIGGAPNVSDVYGAGASFTPQSVQQFKAPTTGAIPTDPIMPTQSDERTKSPTSLSTTHSDTTGPASSSVSMARMLAARDAEQERQKKAKEYGGLVASTINGLGQAFAQQPQAAHFTPAQPQMQQITVSDDKSKLAAAWDQGHNDALDQVQKFRQMSPDELKVAGARGNRIANAVRGAKADAYDEAKGVNKSMTPSMTREPTSFTREQPDVAYVAPQPPPTAQQAAMMVAPPTAMQASMVSDDNAKLSMSGAMGRRQVGTLGKEVPSSDVADFARSLRSTPYKYKDDYARREGQAPGEVNVGPVAQEVEKSRIGSTIVKPDPAGSGMRTLDQTKMVKGLGAVAASHQDKLDEHERTLSLMARRLGGGR